MTGPAATTRLGRVRARVQGRLRAGGRYRWWVLGVALAGIMATSFPVTVLAASLKEVAADFDTSESVLVWVVTAPMLISALALPVLGKLGDLYGHRRVYLTGFAAATAIAFMTALAWDPLSLIGLRTLAQVTGAAKPPTPNRVLPVKRPKVLPARAGSACSRSLMKVVGSSRLRVKLRTPSCTSCGVASL